VELDFYYNHIRKIPDGIGNLTKLKQLFLSYNQIQLLPDTLAALKRLKYMYIHHNGLAVAPQWITTLPKLERLDLSYNRLDSIPDLSHMENLVEIDLQHNELKRFPWELLDKENLNFLIFKNNPFFAICQDAVNQRTFFKTQKS
jgi:Leucine-rich repeat (LRR) protein